MNFRRIMLVCGHYGCGKTNLSLNLALNAAASGENVTVVDLDIVNPYFRSSDYSDLLKSNGIRLIAPRYAGSTLDIPSIPGEINSVFDSIKGRVIFDVGGDDAGATALGRFARQFEGVDYDLLYVINKYRPLTAGSGDAAQLLYEIERSSRLKATGIINNSHLMNDTTRETVLESLPFARETAEQLKLPLLMTTAPRSVAAGLKIENLYPIDIYVRTPWM